jgi:hypothetical protein
MGISCPEITAEHCFDASQLTGSQDMAGMLEKQVCSAGISKHQSHNDRLFRENII